MGGLVAGSADTKFGLNGVAVGCRGALISGCGMELNIPDVMDASGLSCEGSRLCEVPRTASTILPTAAIDVPTTPAAALAIIDLLGVPSPCLGVPGGGIACCRESGSDGGLGLADGGQLDD